MSDELFTPAAYYTRAASTSVDVVDVDEGRVLGRVFPIGERAYIREVGADGQLAEYVEHFLPGCTTKVRQDIARLGRANFLGLQLGHDEPGVERHLGYGLALDERADGAYVTFQLYRQRADYTLVREMLGTAWRGLSVQFHDLVRPRVTLDDDGRTDVGRRQVAIEHTAAVPVPAYTSAGVVSIREGEVHTSSGTPALDRARALLAELRGEPAP